MSNQKKFAVVLAGCGVLDGAEIHESVMTYLSIMKNGGIYETFAPDINQHHVVNHFTGKETSEKRNVLVEAARIARRKIKPLNEFKASDFDAMIFPGGFGVAKNLCDYAFKGSQCNVLPEIEKVIKEMVSLKKPVGAMCISPVIIARIFGNVEVTIGSDSGTISDVEKMGSKHRKTSHGEIAIDENLKIVTTPCYMLDATILDIEKGTDALVKAILKLM